MTIHLMRETCPACCGIGTVSQVITESMHTGDGEVIQIVADVDNAVQVVCDKCNGVGEHLVVVDNTEILGLLQMIPDWRPE